MSDRAGAALPTDEASGGKVVDGRTARSIRTRRAVVDALLALIEEGDVRPTGPRIAERAGVSLRSVFQHFTDLEALFAAAADRELERLAEIVVRLPTEGPFEGRLEAFVTQRARIHEALTPVRRASLLQEPFSEHLTAVREVFLSRGRAEVGAVFRIELDAMPASERDEVATLLDAITTWFTWDTWRSSRRLSVEQARAVMAAGIRRLLAPGRPSAG
jgi:TetR/AcrR family transcriptional regulator, regulator of autoinduction and epiphytic fitness